MALPAHSTQPAKEIESLLEGLRGSYESVYVVAREQAGWANAGVVTGWMRDHLQEVMRTEASGLPVSQFMEWEAEGGLSAAAAVFGGSVALVGYEFFDEPLPTGEMLLWLYWKPLAQTAARLKSFVHVYGDAHPSTGGNLWAQDDQFPQRGRLDSTTWDEGRVFRDVYYLPSDSLENGEYRLSVGWYDPINGQRLLQPDGADTFALRALQFAKRQGSAR